MIGRIALLLSLVAPSTALAGNCAGLRTLAGLAESGFSAGPPDTMFTEAESCELSRNDDGTQTYLCNWDFPYRAPGAAAVLDMLDRAIPICVRGAKALPTDSSVNHPDSYDLRRYQRGDVTISTSLKDKASLEKTIVFLRIDTQ